ncbi:MAG: hypothetical protein WA294_14925 [Acidobacteriaceae bacterium]
MLRKFLGLALLFCGCCACAQSVSPVIVEYKVKASGRIALTNNTLQPLAVVLEPKSFDVTTDGNGVYRPLDPDIHLKLSAMSFRVDPGQTYYVFYSASADKLPAWFTIYSVFSSLHHTSGLDVRILLPHTVYLYPKKQLGKNEIAVGPAAWSTASNKLICDIENHGPDLERVQEVRIEAGPHTETAPGFPLLPGGKRHLELSWNEKVPPQSVRFQLEHSVLQQAVRAGGQ